MVLTPEDRGIIEMIIDQIVKTGKNQKKDMLNPKVKQALHLKSPEDFVFGMFYGELNSSISSYFTTVKRRMPDLVELAEITDIILKRLPEIRNSIYFTE